MIVYGHRAITFTVMKGIFHCPECVEKVNFRRRKVRKWFTLYFIPTFPYDTLGEYVECQKCMGTFTVDTISYDPEVARQEFQAAYLAGMKRVMVQMMLADGRIEAAEIQLLRGVYRDLCGRTLSDQEIDEEIKSVPAQGWQMSAYVQELSNKMNDHGRLAVLNAAVLVATADGAVDHGERELLTRMAAALRVPPGELNRLLSDAGLRRP